MSKNINGTRSLSSVSCNSLTQSDCDEIINNAVDDLTINKSNSNSNSRPQSTSRGQKAKRVRFYHNGNKYFNGILIPVNADRYRTFDSLTSELTKILMKHVTLPSGVRAIYDMKGQKNLNSKILANVIVQIFSPIVTSQRIMSCQFGNSYTSIQCQDGLNITFEEYMGFLFVCIGLDEVPTLKRYINTCVTIVRYLCGPDVLQLKSNPQLSALITKLIDNWTYLHNHDQVMFVEAVEQLMINAELSAVTLNAVQKAVEKLQSTTDCNKIHAMILVQNKFLALYSSQTAKELSPTDILFTTLLCEHKKEPIENESESESEEEFYSPSSSPTHTGVGLTNLTELFHPEIHDISSYQVLLAGSDFTPKCIPHAVHIAPLGEGVHLVVLMETGNAVISSSLYNTFLHLHVIQSVQMQRDVATLRPAFDNLDTAVKKLCDGLRKVKSNAVEYSYRQLMKRWDLMRKKYLEFMKVRAMEALLRAEASTAGLIDSLKEALSLTAFDQTILKSSQRSVCDVVKTLIAKLSGYNDFLKVKALKNFSLGSDSLTINKYLEEFPGLVHFLYIDRTSHRVTAPSLDFNSEQTNTLTKKKIWSMISFSRSHLQEGHLSLMWKDTTFNYAYFLWFEDVSGAPLKPTIFPTNASKALPQAGILCGDFYQKLKESCFPKMSSSKIRCYELFCIHLGLATASCVLEHTRRLAATIWELRGHPNHPMDLL